MLSFLLNVCVVVLVVDFVLRRGAQLWSWVTAEEKVVVSSAEKVAQGAVSAVESAAQTTVSTAKNVVNTVVSDVKKL